ncbi:MAG: prenyltransferase/squalene oxidase repeat-containing protein [Planctomycetota bacterium]
MISLLATFVLVSAPLGAIPSTPALAAPAQSVDLKTEIDRCARWLRGSQNLENGSYGGTVEGTAWALRALHGCHRKYRMKDGPFITKALDYLVDLQQGDGSIHDEQAETADIPAQTALAVMALNLFADDSIKDALARALAYVGRQTGLATPDSTLELPADAESAKAAMAKLLAARDADSSWDGPRGKVITTARNLVVLNAIYDMTKPPDAPPGVAKDLPTFEAADRAKAAASLAKGGTFLLGKQKDGKFEGRPGKPDAGITAMAIGALLCVPEPRPPEVQKAIDSGLAWIASLQKPNGSIHDGEMANYVTCASVLALARSKKPEYAPVIAKARDFLLVLQNDEAEGFSPDHPFYGGNSYGNEERPDLSNVQMALEALAASGLEKGHEAYQRALVFLSRCQNRSESNTLRYDGGSGNVIVSGDDGGATYAPGDSKAGTVELANGKKVGRSYGSMTYALLKSFIFAGLSKDDPRMQACWEWLKKNYTLDVNPGFESSKDPTASYQGLFYYFHTMAKALDLYGEETIVDAQGKSHPWRAELCGRLVAMQRKEDGSWKNENSSRWWEGNPVLATSYALVTLDAAMPR